MPNDDGPLNAIFAFWDDLNPENENNSCSNEGSGKVYHETFDDKKVIWFNNIVRCGSNPDYEGLFDFQVVLYKNQKIDINYRTMEGYTSSATIGIQNNTATDAIQIVYNDDYTHNQLKLTFKPTADWLAPLFDSNSLNFGEQIVYDVEVDGNLLEDENDLAYIIINSNSSDPVSVIPITATLADNSVPGDVNGDDIANVLDIVIIVNLIIGDSEYSENADLNLDGIVNVLDLSLIHI